MHGGLIGKYSDTRSFQCHVDQEKHSDDPRGRAPESYWSYITTALPAWFCLHPHGRTYLSFFIRLFPLLQAGLMTYPLLSRFNFTILGRINGTYVLYFRGESTVLLINQNSLPAYGCGTAIRDKNMIAQLKCDIRFIIPSFGLLHQLKRGQRTLQSGFCMSVALASFNVVVIV